MTQEPNRMMPQNDRLEDRRDPHSNQEELITLSDELMQDLGGITILVDRGWSLSLRTAFRRLVQYLRR